MNAFLQSLKNLGPARLGAMVGVAVGVVGFFIYLTARLSTPQLELLYAGLEGSDATQVMQKLDAAKVPYELRNQADIFVPGDQVAKLRLQLAESALPSGGSMGYEIFDKSDSLSTTNFMQNLNMVRALEGELSRTIRSITGVKSARVHLVLPKREVFSRDMQQPSASIILKMAGSQRLGKQQVLAIQHLTAAAVPHLKPERISIVDDKGTLLARGFDNPGEMAMVSAEELRLSHESRLARTVEQMLERSVGTNRVRAEVNIEMDFDRVVSNEEKYDPEGQVVRSTQTVAEKSASADGEANSVTVAQNLPDAGQSQNGQRTSSNEQRTQETVNYEISKKITSLTRENAVVKRLSVAVVVDGLRDESGQYQARKTEEMDQLAALVRSAVGFDAKRGDTIEVVNLPFVAPEQAPPEESTQMLFGLEKADLMKMAEVLILSIVAILVILLVVRPLVTRAFESLPAAGESMGRKLLGEPGAEAPALSGPGMGSLSPAMAPPDEDNALEELIDIDKVEGRVKASSMRKISEIVEKHPEEALSIVRNWMFQEN